MRISLLLTSLLPVTLLTASPKLPGIGDAMQEHVDSGAISGAVTMVVAKDRVLHLEATGLADTANGRPMKADSLFAIKSMTKPVTGIAILMLQDQGKLQVEDPVARYIPEFAKLETPSGQPANVTIAHLLTHTSGLGEGQSTSGSDDDPTRTLADLVRQALASPMQFEPGEKWKYCQSGINTAGRIVEIISGMTYDQYLAQRLFEPLRMSNTTHYPGESLQQRLVTVYRKNRETGKVAPLPPPTDLSSKDRPPLANSGLFSTAPDYARLCQMLLSEGELDGHGFLEPDTVKLLATPRTGDLKAGFAPGSVWGLAVGIVDEPQDVTAMFSTGTFGHGGAYGTQAWIDPARGAAFILMIQRTNFGNGDISDIRRDFQQAAVDALDAQ